MEAERLLVGLMSGTSADAIDAALVAAVPEEGARTRYRVLAHRAAPLDPGLRRRILALANPGEATGEVVDELLELDLALGIAFAAATSDLLERRGTAPGRIRGIGLHGQTVRHRPPRGDREGSTLQIGRAAVVAERTGIRVVHDFRSRDLAAGGQGAPLVPLADALLFGEADASVATLNLGGVANLSWIPALGSEADPSRLTLEGYDIGPANGLMDAVCRLAGIADGFDRDGRLAAAGSEDPAVLAELLGHPYLALPPPRSTGPEEFGEAMAARLLPRLPLPDLMATLVRFTATIVGEAILDLARRKGRPARLLVAGGGVRNPVLMERLRSVLGSLPMATTEACGVPEAAREAAAFAILADRTLDGLAGNVPAVTGARGPRVLGSVTAG